MRKFIPVFLPAWIFAGLFFFLSPQDSEAIPAFARDKNLPCTFCHTGFPKLNAMGIHFKQNGYRMPGEKGSYLWEKPIPMSVKLDFSLPAYTNRQWSLADPEVDEVPPGAAFGEEGETRADSGETAFKFGEWALFAGGTVAPKVSFLFEIEGEVKGLTSSNQGFPAPKEGSSETEIETEIIVGQIDDIFADALLNLRIGKDHVDHLFLSRPRRLTLAPYLSMFQPFTGGSLHPNVVGVELNGLHSSGFWYSVGVRNLSPKFNSKDDDEVRPGAFYGFFNYPVGDHTISVMFSSDKIGNANSANPDETTMGAPNFPNTSGRTWAGGAALDLNWGNFNLIPAFYYYNESADVHGGEDLDVISGTVETHYFFTPELIGTFRWDYLKVINEPGFSDDIDQFVANLAWYFHPNVRMVVEYSFLDAELRRMTTSPTNNSLFTSIPGQFSNANNTRANLTQSQFTMAFEFNF